ncbi:MAG: hypothetical protein JSS19_15385 [Proteobacteria bacterium]|nr:hypothetical protein [Pseudomonadota bacterium]MBS0610716.1 hypothetical protein [Pseudomonadota bacterium]
MEALGTPIDDALRNNIFDLVGLDIGADTLAEVALAISAEIQALIQGRHGGHARLRTALLHTDAIAPKADANALSGPAWSMALQPQAGLTGMRILKLNPPER